MTAKDGSLYPTNPPKLHNPEDFRQITHGRCVGIGIDSQEALSRFYDDMKTGRIGKDSKYALINNDSHKIPTGHNGGELSGKATATGDILFLEKDN